MDELNERIKQVRQLRRAISLQSDMMYDLMQLLDSLEENLLDETEFSCESWERIGEPWLMVK